MAKTLASATILAAGLALAGCCDCGPGRGSLSKGNAGPLPPPISMAQQIDRLNARTRSMSLLRGTAPLGGAIFRYVDDHQKSHREPVDGTLLIRQHFDEPGRAADVVLYGRVAGQEVLQAGANNQNWWCILRTNGNQAWVGDIRASAVPTDDQGGPSILRADRILDVLGLTLIRPDADLVVMHPSDNDRSNVLLFESPADAGKSLRITRQMTVDRSTGYISDVLLFAPDGSLLVRAYMDTYRPIEYQDAAARPAGPVPEMPHHVVIEFPAAKASVEMKFNAMVVPARVNPAAFETPDWQDQGLTPTLVQ